MRKLRGGSLILTGAFLIILGAILRWDLIDAIVDAAGFLLIVIGIIVGIVGLWNMLSGGGGRSRDF